MPASTFGTTHLSSLGRTTTNHASTSFRRQQPRFALNSRLVSIGDWHEQNPESAACQARGSDVKVASTRYDPIPLTTVSPCRPPPHEVLLQFPTFFGQRGLSLRFPASRDRPPRQVS